jgi:hypothetical protein
VVSRTLNHYIIEIVRKAQKTKKKHSSKRKTSRHIHKRRTLRKKCGVNNNFNYLNNEFIERRDTLINTIQGIIDSIEERVLTDEITFVDEIRAFETEADRIDNWFGSNEMEYILNQALEEGMITFGLIVENNNNNNTISIVSTRKEPNSNMSNNNMN